MNLSNWQNPNQSKVRKKYLELGAIILNLSSIKMIEQLILLGEGPDYVIIYLGRYLVLATF
jgi:hypothetical protein